MALLVCRKCGTRFSVGAPFCPQCTHESAYLEDDTKEEEAMPRNTVAGASLGVNHPDYDPDGPVPPIVPDGVALDAPIADQLDALEAAKNGDESTSDEPDPVDVDGDGIDDVTKQPVKKAPAKAARK